MLARWRSCYRWSGHCKTLASLQRTCLVSGPFARSRTCHARHFTQLHTQTQAQIHSHASNPEPWSRQRRKDTIPTPDTIYALSTAPGRAAIAIVRVSGPACLDIYGALCPDRPFPRPRIATLRRLLDPSDVTRTLDPGALVLYFPAPKTVTGEEILELHVHGGPAIVRSILEAVPKCTNTRPRRRTAEYSVIRAAEPGEFTKRAFYNGRLDLTQAEALGESLAAETEQQRRLAVAGAESGLAARYDEWRKRLLYARGELEALIDFSEDQHFDESPAEFTRSVEMQVQDLRQRVHLHIQNGSRGELLRDGIKVALLGAPNAGKSSLLNCIVGREAAIVSAEAGTTRDIVDVSVDIAGWLVRLGDTAGLRADGQKLCDTHIQFEADADTSAGADAIGTVEREGIRRARERALQSDLVIVLIALVTKQDGAVELSLNPELLGAVEQCHQAGKTLVFAVNKVDLLPLDKRAHAEGGLRQRILRAFPSLAHEENVFLISCTAAASSSQSTVTPTFTPSATPTLTAIAPPSMSTSKSMLASAPIEVHSFSPSHSSSISQMSDPSGVQTLLAGLAHVFTVMTSAVTESDPSASSIPTPLSSAEAQSYWTASLSVTHRQKMYLQQCLAHLDDFLAQCAPRGRAIGMFSHHVDGHDDLVGERVYEAGELSTLSMPPSPRQPPAAVASAASDVEGALDIVTAAEHLRYAAECLSKITGRGDGGDVDDVLGVVFEK